MDQNEKSSKGEKAGIYTAFSVGALLVTALTADLISDVTTPEKTITVTVNGMEEGHYVLKTNKGDFGISSGLVGCINDFRAAANQKYELVVQDKFFGLLGPTVLKAKKLCP